MPRLTLPILAAAACLLATGSARGDFRSIEIIEKSYELMLQDVTFPSSTAGTIIFRECPTCDARSLRVTAATQYLANGVERPLADFTIAARQIGNAGQDAGPTGVYVYYDIESMNVKRVRLVQFRHAQ